MERAERESGELRQEVDLLRSRLEETEWGLCQKSGELALLKSQLKETQVHNHNRQRTVYLTWNELSIGRQRLCLCLQVRDKTTLGRFNESTREFQSTCCY